jgi:hypothetical protein
MQRKIASVTLLPAGEDLNSWRVGNKPLFPVGGLVSAATSISDLVLGVAEIRLSSRDEYEEETVAENCSTRHSITTVVVRFDDGSSIEFDRTHALIEWGGETNATD